MRVHSLLGIVLVATALGAGLADASHGTCGTPDMEVAAAGWRVRVWGQECAGASVVTPETLACAGDVHQDAGVVTVVALSGEFPCTVAGAWVHPL